MSHGHRYLDQAFKDAFEQARDLDQQGVEIEDPEGLFADASPSHVHMVEEVRDYYQELAPIVDQRLRAAVGYLDSDHAGAQVKALEASFDSPTPNPLSRSLANEIRGQLEAPGAEEQKLSSSNLAGFGIGVSVGASAFVGVLAGADVVFIKDDKSELHGRSWAGLSFKTGLSINLGLELSFWTKKPLDGAIAGWVLDIMLLIPGIPIPIWIRVMLIKQRPTGEASFANSGLSIQLPLGIGLPLRKSREKNPKLVGGFAARQKAWSRKKAFIFDVVNDATQLNSIAVNETATLDVSLKSTEATHDLPAGSTLTLDMPGYFTNSDIGAMSIALTGWTFKVITGDSDTASELQLTLDDDWTWSEGTTLKFQITNVKSSNTPKQNEQAATGLVGLDLSADSLTVNKFSAFDLVWASSKSTLNWTAKVDSNSFEILGDSSGTTGAYALPGNEVQTLTTAQRKSDGSTWVLGYIYNYNTLINQPQISAAWWKKDTAAIPNKTLFQSNSISSDGNVTAWFGGNSTSGDSISIDVTFDS